MRKYDYLFLKENIPGKLIRPTNVIASLNERTVIKEQRYRDSFDVLQKKAIIESVSGSNAIEGIIATEERIRDIVDGSKPETHDEMEISGYKEALNLIHSSHDELDINKEFLFSLHRMLFENSDPRQAGRFKTRDNYIMEYQSDGTRRIRFTAVPAKETEEAVEQMLMAYYEARQDYEVPGLLLIPCFVLDFLCIHPFSDGNGRISRLLMVLMLYMEGYDIGRYISIEKEINRYKDNYYDCLERSSVNWHENRNDYTSFMIFFLQILCSCYKKLDDTFLEESLNKAKKSDRIETLVLSSVTPLSKKEIQERFPDISAKTIEKKLGQMLKEGKIRKIGTYKDARYISCDD